MLAIMSYIVSLRDLAQNLGFKVYRSDLSTIKARGLCMPGFKKIMIDDKQDVVLVPFILAHEIGHAMSYIENPETYIKIHQNRDVDQWLEEENTAWENADIVIRSLQIKDEQYMQLYEDIKAKGKQYSKGYVECILAQKEFDQIEAKCNES